MTSIKSSTDSISHVAIIMDGNGRWAQMRSHERVWGHVRGSLKVSEIVEAASDLKIRALTMYAFSTENWCRPQSEVKVLFKLLHKFLLKERAKILKNKICFKIIGDISDLPPETKELIWALEGETKNANGLKLSFAFSYGSRDEIIKAVNCAIKNNPQVNITEEMLSQELMTSDLGDVDLLIRTGGDQRVSNFLLWQIAYAELYFTNSKWPDFSVAEFTKIIDEVRTRERRFGAISSSVNLVESTAKARINKVAIKG
jgi:undecaprenyl diphosphate synthase